MMTRPWISANLAISADGRISTSDRRPSGWTSAIDHQRLLVLRRGADALMVGRGTLEADRMTLTVPDALRQPLRCIVSRRGVLDPAHPVFSRAGGAIHLLVNDGGVSPVAPAPTGVTVHHTDLTGFLSTLATAHGVGRLHCEGGGMLVRELAELDLLDELHLTLAGHTMFGGADAPTLTGTPGDFLPASRAFSLVHFDPRPDLGECFLSYRRQGRTAPADQ
jgi:2,5-diamino-6-(ribosylamino)-4(3H)-pyrimidinone 5'-phosphate reductase